VSGRTLGIDVGGTFTDFVVLDEDGSVSVFKRLTTPSDPAEGVLSGTAELAAAHDLALGDVERILHGTTLVSNSLIERRGARTALVSTRGFRDVLEIGNEARYDLYDLSLVRPEPLVERPLRFEVGGRILADGSVHEELDPSEVGGVAGELLELGVESVAVSLLNSYVNPAHEVAVREAIAAAAPELDISLSAEVAPEWREFERSSTVAANAFVRPLVRSYLSRLERGFTALGLTAPLYVVLSQGGVTSVDVAVRLAVQLVESGPAGGVIAASFFAARLGLEDVVSFDMGGTTAKVSLVQGGEPLKVPSFEVARVARFKRGSGLPLQVPTIELVEIGAGGGSIGRYDQLGLLQVGPESSSADPGPACYGRGGTAATVTDADLHLGFLDPEYFVGGEMQLYQGLAEEALARLGEDGGLDADACARGIFEVVNDQMALAVRTHIVERGQDPRRLTIVAFGGAGPVHAYEVARLLGTPRLIYPPAAGVASALGFLAAPFSVDLAATDPGRLGELDWAAAEARLAGLEGEARELLADVSGDGPLEFDRRADMRYAGQGYSVPVPLPGRPLGPADAEPLAAAFADAYGERFGATLPGAEIEALHWRLTARVPREPAVLHAPEASAEEARCGSRPAYFPELGERVEAAVWRRAALAPGDEVAGPALVEERETTIVIGPSGHGTCDELGNLVVELSP
jgi:N-methylhydantoinase A